MILHFEKLIDAINKQTNKQKLKSRQISTFPLLLFLSFKKYTKKSTKQKSNNKSSSPFFTHFVVVFMQREVFNYLTLRGFFCNAQHPLTFLIHVKNPSSKYCNSVEHQIYFWGAQKGLLLRYSNVAGVFNGRKSTFLLLSYRTVLWLQLSNQ